MPKRHHITEEQVKELKAARKTNKDKNKEKRLKALLLHAEGEKCAVIAERTGYTKNHVSKLISKYMNEGLAAITENHYGGNRRNLSFAAEEAVLEPFKKAAENGQIIEVGEIKSAYEKAIGRELVNNHGQIYYVLNRHGWRKIMPRSRHPKKASDEVIETSKKLTVGPGNWRGFSTKIQRFQRARFACCFRTKQVSGESTNPNTAGIFRVCGLQCQC
jgi:transposase